MSARSLVARVEEHVGLRTADLPRGLVWVYFVGALFAASVVGAIL